MLMNESTDATAKGFILENIAKEKRHIKLSWIVKKLPKRKICQIFLTIRKLI
jgi:hypothetical protein